MYLTGFADEAAKDLAGQIRATRELGWSNIESRAIDGVPLIAPAEEGIRSVELANSMLYSSLTGKTVEFPLDGAAFERRLKKLIRESKFEKAEETGGVADLSGSFNTQA